MQTIAEIAQRIKPGVSSTGISWQTLAAPPERHTIPQQVKLAHVQQNHDEIVQAVKAIRAWAAIWPDWKAQWQTGNRTRRAPSLVFSGRYGTGKTMLARVILWSMVDCAKDENGYDIEASEVPAGRFILAGDLMLLMGAYQDHETKTIEPARPGLLLGNAPLVVVDDVGGEGNIPYIAADDQKHERHARYFRFIDHCYEAGVSVILTTNLRIDRDELANHIGGRAWDRLLEMAPAGSMVSLWGVPSWRRKAGGR